MRVSARKVTLLGQGLVLPQELGASSTHRVLSALILLKNETRQVIEE